MENRRLSRVILSVGSVNKNTGPDVKMLSAGTRVLWARWQFGAERLWIYQTPPPHIRRPIGPWLFQILLSLLKEFSPPPNPLPWDPENVPSPGLGSSGPLPKIT